MDKDIDYYLSAFEKMKRAIMRGVKAPHKPLLAICKKRERQRLFNSSLKALRDGFAYAEIDQELYDLMVNRESAVILECKLRELV